MLGKFEEIVLLAMIKSTPPSSAADIYMVISVLVNSDSKFAATFSTLSRLEKKGFIKSKSSIKEGSDGKNRRTKLYSATGLGESALRQSLSKTDKLRSGIPNWSLPCPT